MRQMPSDSLPTAGVSQWSVVARCFFASLGAASGMRTRSVPLGLSMSDVVVYDKAKWHFGGDYPADLDDDYAYTHAGYFFGWIVDNDLADPDFLDDNKDAIARFRRREISARDLFIITDGALVDDMMNDTGNAFAAAYFDFDRGEYLDDYDAILCADCATMYHVEDTPENYARICARITERFLQWKASR